MFSEPVAVVIQALHMDPGQLGQLVSPSPQLSDMGLDGLDLDLGLLKELKP